MMEPQLLTKQEIKDARDAGDIVIEPLLDDKYITSTGIDLRLDVYFKEFLGRESGILDVLEEVSDNLTYRTTEAFIKVAERRLDIDPILLYKAEFMLAQSLEYISLADNIVGHLDGRSSLGRRGLLVHATAGIIDPGFTGHIVLELGNIGRLPLKIYPLMRIARIQFWRVNKTEAYSGQFKAQTRIKSPKPDQDLLKVMGRIVPDEAKEAIKAIKSEKIKELALPDKYEVYWENYLTPTYDCPYDGGKIVQTLLEVQDKLCLYYVCNINPKHSWVNDPPVCLRKAKI